MITPEEQALMHFQMQNFWQQAADTARRLAKLSVVQDLSGPEALALFARSAEAVYPAVVLQ